MEGLLGGLAACVSLHDGIQRCCNPAGCCSASRSLAARWRCPRRAVAVRGEAPLRELGARPRPQGVACQRDFLLARVGAGSELVDLTEDDIRLWMFWLGLDYILHR
jgi:hypothetical protein